MDDESVKLLADYVDGNSDAATEIYHKYIHRLVSLAKKQLSPILTPRVDPEEIAHSALKSVLSRAKDEQIVLKRSGDLWRVLAGFTIKKSQKRIERELAQKRDPRREAEGSAWVALAIDAEPTAEQVVAVLETLETYVQRLSLRDRLILELRLRGESVPEIAEQLKQHTDQLGEDAANTTEATIRRVLHQAQKGLRGMLFED